MSGHFSPIVACLWDFDKTLIPGNMQEVLFDFYGIDKNVFWEEVNTLPSIYAKSGIRVSKDTIYLNHILTYVQNGPFKDLTNQKLREFGKNIKFYDGLPDFFQELKLLVKSKPDYVRLGIQLEHYIISTGLKEMILGSAISEFVDEIYACEFIEEPLPPGYLKQNELNFESSSRIQQIGFIVDNTIKTRFIFELNKGVNKNSKIDVNAFVPEEDRRIPIKNMIYTADGPSDIPTFSVVNHEGGKTFAVYNPKSQKEFEQNDRLLQNNRIHCYGPANYTPESSTYKWLKMHVLGICDRIVEEHETAIKQRVSLAPSHIHETIETKKIDPIQTAIFSD